MDELRITSDGLPALISAVLKDGCTVLVEASDGGGFTEARDAEHVAIDTSRPPTRFSFKHALVPRSEPIFFFRRDAGGFALADARRSPGTTVIFGARPCDTKSVSILAAVFDEDPRDDFFASRADSTIVIGSLCRYSDAQCFCTSVGLGPASTDGSDAFLIPLADGSMEIRAITGKGARFLEQYRSFFEAGDPEIASETQDAVRGLLPRFDSGMVRSWIASHFDDAFWDGLGDICLGCAQCAFVCPVCHCFDLVDERVSSDIGRRMKNWDACQAGLFTKHASGHNPRGTQAARFRQRVSHKFSYFPERFGEILCTGCGRCTRGCAVGMDLGAIAEAIDVRAAREAAEAGSVGGPPSLPIR